MDILKNIKTAKLKILLIWFNLLCSWSKVVSGYYHPLFCAPVKEAFTMKYISDETLNCNHPQM
jgi:hypothetical protein